MRNVRKRRVLLEAASFLALLMSCASPQTLELHNLGP